MSTASFHLLEGEEGGEKRTGEGREGEGEGGEGR